MVKMFFSVFGQTQKHVLLSVFGSASPPQPPCVFQYLGDWLKTRVFYCFSEALYCFCHLGVLPAAAARSWQHLKEERDAQNDETTL